MINSPSIQFKIRYSISSLFQKGPSFLQLHHNLDILSKSNILAELAALVALDKDVLNATARKFFLVLSGDKSQKKEKILDEAMSHFYENHCMKKSIHPKAKSNAPTEYDFNSSFATDLKTLFEMFKSNGVTYSIKDFEKDGTFLSNL